MPAPAKPPRKTGKTEYRQRVAALRTELLDISTFTANTHYPNGYIPSGLPVAKVGGVLVPYDATEGTTTGAGILAGFVLTDQKVVGTNDFAVPVLDHGRIRAAKVSLMRWSSSTDPYCADLFGAHLHTPLAAADLEESS